MSKPIRCGIISEGTSNLKVHALREDGTASCSNYLFVRPWGAAKDVDKSMRCKSPACRKRFAEADQERLAGESAP